MADETLLHTTTDLQARMEALVRRMSLRNSSHMSMHFSDYVEAVAIVAELPKPIDPDVLAVREILGAGCAARYDDFSAENFRSGAVDSTEYFTGALAAYKRIKSGGVA